MQEGTEWTSGEFLAECKETELHMKQLSETLNL